MEEGIKGGAFSPNMPVEYISRLLVYVIHGVIYNAALYNREADSIDWVQEFCNNYLENTALRPYLLPQKD